MSNSGRIYDVCQKNKTAIVAFVPYGMAVRAYLSFKKILRKDRHIIFMDKFEDHYLLTLFSNSLMTEVRRILTVNADIKEIVWEIQRSLDLYKTNAEKEQAKNIQVSFYAVSNDQNVLDCLLKERGLAQEEICYVNDRQPSLIGLQQAKFSRNFILPEVAKKQRQAVELKKRFITTVTAAVVIGAGLLIRIGVQLWIVPQQHRLQATRVERDNILAKMADINSQKYRAVLSHQSKLDISHIYEQFINNVPDGYTTEKFFLEKDTKKGTWRFEALVYLSDPEGTITDFGRTGLFKDRTVTNISFKKRPGLRVNLGINR